MTTQSTILVVSETPASLELLTDNLTADGFQVLAAKTGELALAAVTGRAPELILVELRGPGMDGFEVCRQLKARPESREIPVVIISGSGEGGRRMEGLKLGAADCLTLPLQREELLARIKPHLELRRLRVELAAQAEGLRQVNAQLRAELADRQRATAEEALRVLAARQEAILAAVPDILMEVNSQLVYTWANQPGLDFFGEDVIGREAAGYLADEEPASPSVQSVFSGRQEAAWVESWQRRRDGERRLLAWSCRVLKDGSGNVTGGLASARDITERRQAEREIQHQAAFARFNPNPVLELSAAGDITYFNEAAGQMARALGWEDPEQMLPANTTAMVRACLVTGQPILRVETETGSRVISWSFFPVKFNQTVHGYAGDITERRQAEERLRELSRAVEQSPASVVITDPAGNIEYVNPRFIELTGYTAAEVLGQNPRVLKSGDMDPEAYRELWRTLTAGKEWRGEFHNRKKTGEFYWESASISPIRDPAGRITHYVAVKEDITARKQAELERNRLIHELREALANVKSLSGLLPICAGCKRIRDDQGYWSQVESYVAKHSEARFSHGVCPDCIRKIYPEMGEVDLHDSSKDIL